MPKTGSKLAVVTLLALGAALGSCKSTPDARPRSDRVIEPVWRLNLYERGVALLLTAAESDDPLLRANAIEGLQASPDDARIAVERGLTDSNIGVRFAAAIVAGRLGMADMIGWIQPLLGDPSPDVRAAAVFAMSKIGAESDPTPLASMLLDGTVRTRAQAAFILGEMGDPSAVPLLQEAAQRDTPRATLAEIRLLQLQIAEALVKLDEFSALEPIRAALFPSRPEELESTALAVQIIGQVDDRRSIDQLIYLADSNIDPEAGGPMPAEVRLAAAASLAQLGLPNGSFIADEFARDASPTIRSQSAYVYGQTGDPQSLITLERMLDDQVGLVQVAAAAAILTIGLDS